MTLPQENPRIPEGINAHNESPLREFLVLAAGVSAALVALVFALSLAVRFMAPYLPFAWELAAAPALESLTEETGESQAAASAALQDLGKALLKSSLTVPIDGEDPSSTVPPEHFRFSLLGLDSPNAFATLGAQVAVSDALLAHVQSENGLAMVLAHEIAHVQLRHPIEAAGRGVVVQIALAAILGNNASGLLGGSLGTGSMLTLLSFNREMELQADRRALAILRSHYGHLGGADEFFREMASDPGSPEWLEFAQTHPSTQRRLQLIRGAMRADPVTMPSRPMSKALRGLPRAGASE